MKKVLVVLLCICVAGLYFLYKCGEDLNMNYRPCGGRRYRG